MLELIRKTELPSDDFVAAHESWNETLSTGISLATLKNLTAEWSNNFDWDEEQASFNEYEGNFPTLSFDRS